MPQEYEIVYTTDGEPCAKCHRKPCQCATRGRPPGRGSSGQRPASGGGNGPRLRLEKGGRKGKTVTVVSHLALPEATLRDLLRELQKACGCGGTLVPQGFEIQGDQRDRIEALLQSHGIRIKRSGG